MISDHHLGLKEAIGAVFVGSAWQRCRVHFIRNVLARVPRASSEMVAAAVRTIFAQPDAAHVRSQLGEVSRMLASQFPDVATMLSDAAEDLLAFCAFPLAHWRKIWSTNPLWSASKSRTLRVAAMIRTELSTPVSAIRTTVK